MLSLTWPVFANPNPNPLTLFLPMNVHSLTKADMNQRHQDAFIFIETLLFLKTVPNCIKCTTSGHIGLSR